MTGPEPLPPTFGPTVKEGRRRMGPSGSELIVVMRSIQT